MHDILRRIAIGDLSPEDAPSEFADRYEDEVTYTTKEATMEAVFCDCMNFLAEFDYSYLEDNEVISAEKRYIFDVEGVRFNGYIDLLLRSKKTGEYIVMDYKSCKPFFGKRGKILKTMQDTFDEYKKQMALYCMAVEQNCGEKPRTVMWLHFRNQHLTEYTITEDDIEETKQWVRKMRDAIENDQEFLPIRNWFKCNNICSYRNSCQYLLLDYEEEEEE